jgi:hypothetical protein
MFSRWPHGDSEGVDSYPWVISRLTGHGASGLDPELWGRCPHWLG